MVFQEPMVSLNPALTIGDQMLEGLLLHRRISKEEAKQQCLAMLRRIRIAYTAGEAIGPEIFVFFRALGINVKQLYGMTESSVFVAVQKDGDVRLDTRMFPL